MKDAKITFGRRLRLIRKSRNLTLEELGKAASLGFKHIGDLENAQKAPSFDAIGKLAKALRVAPYEFFLPYETDDERLARAFAEVMRRLDHGASPALKRLLTVLLPLLEQMETDLRKNR